MNDLNPERREALAALLLRHGHAEWDEFDGQVVADALAPLVVEWLAEAWDQGRAAERRDWEFTFDLATPDEDRQPWPNPYRDDSKGD